MLASQLQLQEWDLQDITKEERERGPICTSGEGYEDESTYNYYYSLLSGGGPAITLFTQKWGRASTMLFIPLWGRFSIIYSNIALFTVPELSGHYRSHQTTEDWLSRPSLTWQDGCRTRIFVEKGNILYVIKDYMIFFLLFFKIKTRLGLQC